MRKCFLCLVLFTLAGGQAVAAGVKAAEAETESWSFFVNNRLRYESLSGLFPDKLDSRKAFYNRLRIGGDLKLCDSVKLTAEGLDAREWKVGGVERGHEDDMDLHQAFVTVSNPEACDFMVRLGRQKIGYGSGKTIWAPGWGNLTRSFDAAVAGYNTKRVKADVFYGQVVTYESGFNSGNDDETLSGFYSELGIGDAQKLDLYLVSKKKVTAAKDGGSNTSERHTAGARYRVKLSKDLSSEQEVMYQFGSEPGEDVSAYAVCLSATQKIKGRGDPSVRVEANIASGDSDDSDGDAGTFIPPYQALHAPYGIIDLVKLQNLRELAVVGKVSPTEKLSLTAEFHAYWRDDVNDDWYAASGKALADASDGDDRFIGNELSLVTKYNVSKSLKLEAGYSLFSAGDLARRVVDDDETSFGYIQTVLSY